MHPIHKRQTSCTLIHEKNLSPRFHRIQMQITKVSKVQVIQNPGKNLSVADTSVYKNKTPSKSTQT